MRFYVSTGATGNLCFAVCPSPKWTKLKLCKSFREGTFALCGQSSRLFVPFISHVLSFPLNFQKGILPVNCFLWSGSTGINWRVGPLLCHAGGSQWSLSNTWAQSALGPPQPITSMAKKEPVNLLPTATIYSKLKLTDKIFPTITLATQFTPFSFPPELLGALDKDRKGKGCLMESQITNSIIHFLLI